MNKLIFEKVLVKAIGHFTLYVFLRILNLYVRQLELFQDGHE